MIEATNLTKKFDDILAVDHINAQIREGNVFGLIGTNGAGNGPAYRTRPDGAGNRAGGIPEPGTGGT